MKTLLAVLSIAALLNFPSAVVNAQSLTSVFSAQVEEDEIDVFMDAPDQAFFNVQGDDDAFTVYTLVDFDTSMIGQVTGITSLSLDLTQANAFFSADGDLEFFLASDTRVVDLTDSARYISDQANGGANTGADVVGSAFGTLYPLGTGTYTQTVDGDVDNFVFSLDAGGEAFAVSQINSGGLLRIIGTPSDVAVQATYSGAFSLLDPPGPPVLNVTVTTAEGGAVKGDVNLDGEVTFLDINPFIMLLAANGFQAEADCNCDNVFNFLDIQPFINILAGSP